MNIIQLFMHKSVLSLFGLKSDIDKLEVSCFCNNEIGSNSTLPLQVTNRDS